LSGEPILVAGRPFQISDEIRLRNDYRLDFQNGTTGTITGIDHDQRQVTFETTGVSATRHRRR